MGSPFGTPVALLVYYVLIGGTLCICYLGWAIFQKASGKTVPPKLAHRWKLFFYSILAVATLLVGGMTLL